MVDKTLEWFGRIDILVNVAGVITVNPTEDLLEEEWDSIMATNAKGVFLCCKAVLSQAGKDGFARLPHYCASKFAVVGFTNALAKEVARNRITVNAVCPGIVPTQMWVVLRRVWANPGESEEESYARNVSQIIPQGVDQTAHDMGEAVLYFVLADHVTGQAINVDGGCTLH